MALSVNPIGNCMQSIFIGYGVLGDRLTSKVWTSKVQTAIFSFSSTKINQMFGVNQTVSNELLKTSLHLPKVTSKPLVLKMLLGVLEMHYYLSMLNNPFVGEDIMIDWPSSLIVVSLGYSTSY